MRYPTLTLSSCRGLAEERFNSLNRQLNIEAQWVGDGDDLNLAPLKEAARKISTLHQENRLARDKDPIEGEAAKHLYNALLSRDEPQTSVPFPVLDDPGFWRYLSIGYFWDFIAWREKKSFENGNHMKYIDGKNQAECVLLRMFLRISALGGAEHADLAYELPKATDFWRSHVLRVRTATAPMLTRAIVELQAADRLMTEDLREFAKRVNRTWSNMLLNIYSQSEAEDLLQELRIGLANHDENSLD
ncbi:MAG: hypothetical protein OXF04_09480 [bacterium]|nr:hypothetical protein [bacterium]MCY4273130.1 hypothetical protein [bacterium]